MIASPPFLIPTTKSENRRLTSTTEVLTLSGHEDWVWKPQPGPVLTLNQNLRKVLTSPNWRFETSTSSRVVAGDHLVIFEDKHM